MLIDQTKIYQAKSYQVTSHLAAFFPLFLVISLGIFTTACSSNKDKDGRPLRGSEQDVYESAQYYLKSSNWDTAIEYLESLEENFPFGAYAEQSQLELIFVHFKADNFDAAIASADRFIRLHPQHRNVDYAYYMRGIASYYNNTAFSSSYSTDYTTRDPGAAKDAFSHFSQLINRYPESPYVLDAQKRMVYLRNTIARAEINVANYYFKRGAYLAAANRGRWVVENMQMTPAVPDALAVMAQAYYLLEMEELSRDSIAVLKHNYPDHPALTNGDFDFDFASLNKRSWLSYATFGMFDKKKFVEFDTRDQYDSQTKPIAPPGPPS